jgi:hypothetical protein
MHLSKTNNPEPKNPTLDNESRLAFIIVLITIAALITFILV